MEQTCTRLVKVTGLPESLYAGLLVAVAGLLAWATGRPFVFPSLGPSAVVLAGTLSSKAGRAHLVIGSHAIGVLVGLACYHALAPEGSIQAASSLFALEQARFALSGIASVTLTAAGMHLTDTMHSPACATTLIVSLGFLPTPADGAIIMTSVIALYAVHAVVVKLGPWNGGEDA